MSTTKLESKKPICWILISALLVRLGWVLYTPALPTSDFATYDGLAHRLLQGLKYTTAYHSPGYPFVLAGLYGLFGDKLLVPKLANVVMGVLICLFTYLIATMLFDKRVALVASAIVALLPSHILYSGLLASETLFTCLMLAGTTLFLYGLKRESGGWLLMVLSGCVLGLAALVRAIALFLPGMWMLFLLWRRYPVKQTILNILAVGLATAVVFTPWIMRNYALSGRIVIQTNGGVNWLLGFNDRANGHYVGQVRLEFEEEAREMGLDEFQADALAYRRAFQFIREHPLRAMALVPLKWFHLFKHDASAVVWNFVEPSRPYSKVLWYTLVFVAQAYYMVLLVLTLVGFVSLRRPDVHYPDHVLALGFVLYWLAFHALGIGVDRFHLPLLPILAMYGALGALDLWRRFQDRPIATAQLQG